MKCLANQELRKESRIICYNFLRYREHVLEIKFQIETQQKTRRQFEF